MKRRAWPGIVNFSGYFSLEMKMSSLLKRKKYLEEILEKNSQHDWLLLPSQIRRKLYVFFSSV